MDALFTYRDDTLYCHHSCDNSPDPADFPIHAHETPELFCFLSGKASYLVEGSDYPLCPGDLLLMRPAETHKLLVSSEEPYERIAFHFSPGLFDSLDSGRLLLRPFYDRPLGQDNRYAAELYPDMHRSLSGLVLRSGAERLQLLSRLLLLLTDVYTVFNASARCPPPPNRFSVQLVAYVNEHLFEELSIQEISDHFSRSASQIGRCFREATGTSLWEYVTIKRLLAARAMVQRGESAGEACLSCGFSDYSAFFRAYKKRFGHAPSADRVQ